MQSADVRILMVENDEAVAAALSDLFAACPTITLGDPVARSLAEAETLIREHQFDVIVTDLYLPDLQGESAISTLRQWTHNRIPIIVMIAEENTELIMQSLQLGAQDVIDTRHLTRAQLFRSVRFSVERNQMEIQLQKRTEVLKNVIATIPHFVFWKDRDCVYQGCNLHFATGAGLKSPEEIVGKCDYELAWTREEADFYRECDFKVMENDAPMLHIEETQLQTDGRQISVVTSKVPLKNKDGEVIGILGLFQDVTERRLLEAALEERTRSLEETNGRLSTSQNQLVQSEKMASIGQLAAGVAHEINNPVGFVASNLGTLEEYLEVVGRILKKYGDLAECRGGDDERQALIEEIARFTENEDLEFILSDSVQLLTESQDGTNRIKEIVRNLRSFARLDEVQAEPADLNEGLESTLSIVKNELKYKCEITTKYGEIPPLVCFAGRLNQVFLNLLVNAGHAIEDHGEITIETWFENDEVHVRISDTGSGIAPENVARLFDPFFTTKPVGKGTGLGLSVSYGIVNQHGGRIHVDSEVGKGTAFTISLPIDGIKETEAGMEESPPEPVGSA